MIQIKYLEEGDQHGPSADKHIVQIVQIRLLRNIGKNLEEGDTFSYMHIAHIVLLRDS